MHCIMSSALVIQSNNELFLLLETSGILIQGLSFRTALSFYILKLNITNKHILLIITKMDFPLISCIFLEIFYIFLY